MRWSNEEEVRRSLAKINNMMIDHDIPYTVANSVIKSAGIIVECIKIRDEKLKKHDDKLSKSIESKKAKKEIQ